jgi:2-keto-4-pentenoate hydratase
MVRIAEHVARMGGALKRGHILLTGSALSLYQAGLGDQFVVRSEHGEVRVNISFD